MTWDDPDAEKLPVYKALKPLLPRFMREDGSGLIHGWGIVKWPRATARSRWGLSEGEE